MDLSKACIINAAWQKWYPRGQKRLVESLRYHGFAGTILTWTNEHINGHFDERHPYTIKAAALAQAMNDGYKQILWLDCSVWCAQNPNDFFQIIQDEGVFMWKSGYNLCQTAADSDLQFAGISRDDAVNLDECASSMVGINLDNPKGLRVAETFIEANRAGVCSTSREHAEQSSDPRFLFARQDQTAFTIAFHKSGFTKMYEPGEYTAYYEPNKEFKKSIVFFMQGL